MTRNELATLLNAIAAEAEADDDWGNRQWTQRIKERLIQNGHRRDYMACASELPDKAPKDCQPDWPEWLYDVTWLEGHYDGAGERFTIDGIPLAAEIEWGNEGDVWDDFQKLPIARADVRIMIFDEQTNLGVDDLVRQIERFAGTTKGDRYLLASYNSQTQQFNVVEHEASGLPTFC